MVKLPSGLIVDPEVLMKVIAMSPPPRIVCVTITLPPLSGLPSVSSAVPVTLAVLTAARRTVRSFFDSPTAIATSCASAAFGVPG